MCVKLLAHPGIIRFMELMYASLVVVEMDLILYLDFLDVMLVTFNVHNVKPLVVIAKAANQIIIKLDHHVLHNVLQILLFKIKSLGRVFKNARHQIIHTSTLIQDCNIVWLHVQIINLECNALTYVQSDIILILKFAKNAIKLVHFVLGHL